ncbi:MULTISPECIES: 5-oxoprolinase subunit PxpB [unclassified Streptomyces]|uniref:5-oxoprolinase subunit PxpB n=1 Tax=unclassified Streptomyces TaxID=2593676 RepID=UPI00037816F9|nr:MULTISPECIES: 5-oxoprolinase subunit PxpB [unclassified Streptomyces]MYT28924.1 5-oxoprolinase subunit PxpB [Streptomyces sp. SID8354]
MTPDRTPDGTETAVRGAGRPSPTVLPVGEHGLLIELARAEDAEALHAELLRRAADGRLPAVREIVPAARTVFLDGLADPGALAVELPGWHLPPPAAGDRAAVEIPVHYDGPDLADVAALWGVSADEVVRRHSATAFRVAFCGFAPGFGYLTGLPEHLHVPRRENPRTRVPVGSVGLAGPYTGVYPRSSPGGWQLIGRTEAVLWDPRREPAALLAPGTPVRFVPQDAPVPAPRTTACEESAR